MGDVIGKGSFSKVKLATHIATKRDVAIKQISKKDTNEKLYAMIQNEIEILKLCQHPNISKLIDLFENKYHIFIVQELCKGGDLF